eukprot:Opistho-2@76293
MACVVRTGAATALLRAPVELAVDCLVGHAVLVDETTAAVDFAGVLLAIFTEGFVGVAGAGDAAEDAVVGRPTRRLTADTIPGILKSDRDKFVEASSMQV